MVRIALDAMGGDRAPEVPVAGTIEALGELPAACEILLVGRRRDIEGVLAGYDVPAGRVRVVDAPEVIGMSEKPLAAIRAKRRSSIRVGLDLQAEGEADAFVSAGNTGAVLGGSTLVLGLHPGVERAAIATLFPTGAKPVVVLDGGANVDCSARELCGFAHLGTVYARDVLGRPDPAVGLLNIGEEPEKGNVIVRDGHRLLREDPAIRFVGNVEGRDILAGACDVVVCDGFVGNVVLKFYESVADLFRDFVVREMEPEVLDSPGMRRIFKVLDYSEYGGAPLLGVRGVSIVCHGRSSARAIRSALRVALQSVASGLSGHIGDELTQGEAVA